MKHSLLGSSFVRPKKIARIFFRDGKNGLFQFLVQRITADFLKNKLTSDSCDGIISIIEPKHKRTSVYIKK